jgi:hypothetical protein
MVLEPLKRSASRASDGGIEMRKLLVWFGMLGTGLCLANLALSHEIGWFSSSCFAFAWTMAECQLLLGKG